MNTMKVPRWKPANMVLSHKRPAGFTDVVVVVVLDPLGAVVVGEFLSAGCRGGRVGSSVPLASSRWSFSPPSI